MTGAWPTHYHGSCKALDKLQGRAKIPAFPVHFPDMSSLQPLPSSEAARQRVTMDKPCKHPRVRVVARDEDSEFVECLECAEVFESSEFKDMAIEDERTGSNEA
jgi:hypothetical protein